MGGYKVQRSLEEGGASVEGVTLSASCGHSSSCHQILDIYLNFLCLIFKFAQLCWERPLKVSEVFGDKFSQIFWVFWVETHIFFLRTTLHGLAANKKLVRPKMAVFDSFPERGGWGHYGK